MKDFIYILLLLLSFSFYLSERTISESRQSQIETLLKTEKLCKIREVHKLHETINNYYNNLIK